MKCAPVQLISNNCSLKKYFQLFKARPCWYFLFISGNKIFPIYYQKCVLEILEKLPVWIEPKMSAKGFTCHSSRGKLYFNKRMNDFGVLGGGQMVSVLVCYDAPSLNPAEV